MRVYSSVTVGSFRPPKFQITTAPNSRGRQAVVEQRRQQPLGAQPLQPDEQIVVDGHPPAGVRRAVRSVVEAPMPLEMRDSGANVRAAPPAGSASETQLRQQMVDGAFAASSNGKIRNPSRLNFGFLGSITTFLSSSNIDNARSCSRASVGSIRCSPAPNSSHDRIRFFAHCDFRDPAIRRSPDCRDCPGRGAEQIVEHHFAEAGAGDRFSQRHTDVVAQAARQQRHELGERAAVDGLRNSRTPRWIRCRAPGPATGWSGCPGAV